MNWARLQTVYSTPESYADKVAESVVRLVRERWFTQSDGRRMKEELIGPPAPRTGTQK